MKADPLDRFWRFVRVNPETLCWDWAGARSCGATQMKKDGTFGRYEKLVYGSFWDRVTYRAHVWIAFQFGIIAAPRIPHGMQLDHLCENTLCVSPWHLQLVPRRINYDRRTNRADHPV